MSMHRELNSWSKMTLKLKHEGYKRISQAKGKQRGKQGEATACGKIDQDSDESVDNLGNNWHLYNIKS